MMNNTYLLNKDLNILNGFLENFVHAQDFPATVKDVKTGRYCICNQSVANLSGLTTEKYLGLTAQDIGKINQLKSTVIANILFMDHQVATQAVEFVQFKQAFFTKQKFIYFEEVTKKPIKGQNGNIIAILGYSHDITPYLDLMNLFEFYRQYHHSNKQAIQYFLHYMQLDHFFHELPTKQELIVLLTMRKFSQTKQIADELALSFKTVNSYKAHLRDKLKFINLNDLIIQLRIRHENVDKRVFEVNKEG